MVENPCGEVVNVVDVVEWLMLMGYVMTENLVVEWLILLMWYDMTENPCGAVVSVVDLIKWLV